MTEQTATKVQVLSPYKATTIVNEYLAEQGLTDKDGATKKLPPQMLYQYCNKGYIKATKVEGKWNIEAEALQEWLEAYVTKQRALAEKKAAQLEAELKGEEAEVTEEPSPEEIVEPAADEFETDEA